MGKVKTSILLSADTEYRLKEFCRITNRNMGVVIESALIHYFEFMYENIDELGDELLEFKHDETRWICIEELKKILFL